MGEETVGLLKGLIRARGSLEAPEAPALDPDVRTGETFVLGSPGRTGGRGQASGEMKALVKKGAIMGAIVITWGYDVPPEQGDAFAAWLRDNEADLAASAPKGVHYRGTYGVFSTTEKRTGRYRTVWAYDSLEAMQGMFASIEEDGDFPRLLQQLNDFRDRSREADYSQEILAPAAATVRLRPRESAPARPGRRS